MKKITTRGQDFVYESGEKVILSGINVVCKKKDCGYVEVVDIDTIHYFKENGFNVVRLGLQWDGVAPTSCSYDDHYLEKIAEQITFFEKHDIYVFLDMHQDLYGIPYGDGAPKWATLSDGLPHHTGEVWSDAYLISPAVQRAFDHFWKNTLVDGQGLQEHYVKMWGHVAAFMAAYSFTNLIGYDIMNEPFMGSGSNEVIETLISMYAKLALGIKNPSVEELMGIWFDADKKTKLLRALADIDLYKQIVAGSQEASIRFERNVLSPFYSKVGAEIRKHDPMGILFLSSNYFCNMGIASGLTPIVDEKGVPDLYQAYAPHGYDLVVDTDGYECYSSKRVEFIFNIHKKTGERLHIPTLVGEWGAFYGNDYAYPLTIAMIPLFEQLNFSQTYWTYVNGMEKNNNFCGLKRGYPLSHNGAILGYHYDYSSKTLSLEMGTGAFSATVFHPAAQTVKKRGNPAIAEMEISLFPNGSGILHIRGIGEGTTILL